MRFFLLIFLLFCQKLPSTEPNPENDQDLSSPLLSLTKRYPVTLSVENRMNLLNNPARLLEEREKNLKLIKEKAVPWTQLIAFLIFALTLLIIRMQPKKQPSMEHKKRKEVITAKKRALMGLKVLEKEHLLQKKQYDRYYVRLTNTVRTYIEERYQLKASTLSTPEFLDAMRVNRTFGEETKALLNTFLESADQVKFAAHKPQVEECLLASEMAKKLIEI